MLYRIFSTKKVGSMKVSSKVEWADINPICTGERQKITPLSLIRYIPWTGDPIIRHLRFFNFFLECSTYHGQFLAAILNWVARNFPSFWPFFFICLFRHLSLIHQYTHQSQYYYYLNSKSINFISNFEIRLIFTFAKGNTF